MHDIEVIDDPQAAVVALDPLRARLLAELRVPHSAASLAEKVGVPRQKVNYHLRALEQSGLARLDSRRRWGGLTERRLIASAASYVVSPGALGPAAGDPVLAVDRLSASYLVAVAARAVREVGLLLRRARTTGKRLATLSVDTRIRFRSAAERAAFTHALTGAVASLVAQYHDPDAPGGRDHRLVLVAHPLPADTPEEEQP